MDDILAAAARDGNRAHSGLHTPDTHQTVAKVSGHPHSGRSAVAAALKSRALHEPPAMIESADSMHRMHHALVHGSTGSPRTDYFVPVIYTIFNTAQLLRRLAPILACVLFALPVLALLSSPASFAHAYTAPLPPELSTDPDLCAYAPCHDVQPGADSFSQRIGNPPYVEAYRTAAGKRILIGYVFLSTDIVDIPGYSGKPVVTLIGMDTRGILTGTRILKHSEPILLSGIPESALLDFIHQYVGKFVGDNIEIGHSLKDMGFVGLDAISGATVTVISENQVILRCSRAVAQQVGILGTRHRQKAKFAQDDVRLDWPALLAEGSIGHLVMEPGTVGLPAAGKPYMDLYFGYLNAPSIGRSVLGDDGYESLMSRLKEGDHAIFAIADGMTSFRGFGFVHGGIYDRILVSQDMDTFTFRNIDYVDLPGIAAAGAPEYGESAVFILHSGNFSPAYPWRLIFRGPKLDMKSGTPGFVNAEQEYWLPGRMLEGGRPEYRRPDPTWLRVWKSQPLEIAFFILFLTAAIAVYAVRDRLVRRARRKSKHWVSLPKYALWAVGIGYAGFHLMAQPSITQVLTWIHAVLFRWEWSLFLSDPFIFLFWWVIVGTLIFWGRGFFCGWLCPYGALTEIIYKVAGKLGLKRFQKRLPQGLHDRLKWLKYAIFLALLGASFHSLDLAEKLAEVEPFKTTFLVGVWHRGWPFVAYWLLLMVAATLVERPFCKYLCPLGAGLAIPSTFRWRGLKRKQECGPCTACATGCESRAIDQRSGRIDQRECLLCLDCMVMYYDDHACPPLVQERKMRHKSGAASTPIGANGYFIPIHPEATPSASSTPHAPQRLPVSSWLGAEIGDLFPWRGIFRSQDILLHAIGILLAALMCWLWLLGAAGKIDRGILLGWWTVWTAYELAARMNFKPQVKDGPWWERNFRTASWADMAAHVGLKNFLVAALLFLLIDNFNLARWLQELPEIRWPGFLS